MTLKPKAFVAMILCYAALLAFALFSVFGRAVECRVLGLAHVAV